MVRTFPLQVAILKNVFSARWLPALVATLSLALSASFAAASDGQQRVLLLNSYQQDMTWVKNVTRAVYDVLRPEVNDTLIYVENMDTKRFHDPAYYQSLHNYYQVKYHHIRFDLILSSDNNAFDFLRDHRATLFPGVPVSFCGVNYFKDAQLAGYEGFTGVAEIFDARANVELALSLHPETRKIFIVNDFLKTGRAWEKTIREQLAPLADRVTLEWNENLSMHELREKIGTLEPGTVVLFGVYFADRDKKYITYEKIGAMLAEVSQVPVYALLEFNLQRGVVGGQVISGYYQGETMAKLGLRILAGEKPGAMPVVKTGANRYIFDDRELDRFAIKKKSLPEGSIIINRQFSIAEQYYTAYKTEIWIAVSCLLSLAVALAFCGMASRQRAMEQAHRQNEELKKALSQVKELSGLLPICSSCKKIRDDQGYWNQLEGYVSAHADVQFSHGICPDCVKELYPDYAPGNADAPACSSPPHLTTCCERTKQRDC